MTVSASLALRNAMLDLLTSKAGSGALLNIYTGPRPATGGTPTTLLVQLACGAPFAPNSTTASITPNSITPAPALATGVAVWARLTDSAGNFVIDLDVAQSGSDLNLNNTSIQQGATVAVVSGQFSMGNS